MTKERLLQIAERNRKKAQIALNTNRDRKGVTEAEISNLTDNLKYAEVVYDLIAYHAQSNV